MNFGRRSFWIFLVPILALVNCHPTGLGSERWVYRLFDQSGYGAGAAAVVFGRDGTAYVAGRTQQTIVVVALNSAGIEQWQYRFDTLGIGALQANYLTLGKDGNLYVTGMTGSYGSTGPGFLVGSLTTAGVLRWTCWRADSSYGNGAASVVCGDDGNIYAGGTLHGSFAVMSLTADGQSRWTYERAGFQAAGTSATQVIWGADGNLYVGGILEDTWPAHVGVVSLTPDGGERWVYSQAATEGWVNAGVSLAQGPDGNLYALGVHSWLNGSVYGGELAAISLTLDGQERWVKTCAAASNTYYGAGAGALACGPDTNVYLAFYQPADSGHFNARFSVLSLTGAGEQRWSYAHDRTMQGSSAPSIVMGDDGNLYCAGSLNEAGRFSLASLTGTGNLRWVYQHSAGLFGGQAAALGLAWEGGNVCTGGYADGYKVGQYFLVVSLSAGGGAD